MYWDDREKIKASLCDNASSKALYPIITPQCYNNRATRRATITYNEIESDTLDVCDECAKRLRYDSVGRGYRFKSRKLKVRKE